MSTLAFDNVVNAVLHVNHENLGGDYRAEFRLDGSAGSIRGTLGLLYNYPHGRPGMTFTPGVQDGPTGAAPSPSPVSPGW